LEKRGPVYEVIDIVASIYWRQTPTLLQSTDTTLPTAAPHLTSHLSATTGKLGARTLPRITSGDLFLTRSLWAPYTANKLNYCTRFWRRSTYSIFIFIFIF